MTNRELQDILKQYPDDLTVSVRDTIADDIVYRIDDVLIEGICDENGKTIVESLLIYI